MRPPQCQRLWALSLLLLLAFLVPGGRAADTASGEWRLSATDSVIASGIVYPYWEIPRYYYSHLNPDARCEVERLIALNPDPMHTYAKGSWSMWEGSDVAFLVKHLEADFQASTQSTEPFRSPYITLFYRMAQQGDPALADALTAMTRPTYWHRLMPDADLKAPYPEKVLKATRVAIFCIATLPAETAKPHLEAILKDLAADPTVPKAWLDTLKIDLRERMRQDDKDILPKPIRPLTAEKEAALRELVVSDPHNVLDYALNDLRNYSDTQRLRPVILPLLTDVQPCWVAQAAFVWLWLQARDHGADDDFFRPEMATGDPCLAACATMLLGSKGTDPALFTEAIKQGLASTDSVRVIRTLTALGAYPEQCLEDLSQQVMKAKLTSDTWPLSRRPKGPDVVFFSSNWKPPPECELDFPFAALSTSSFVVEAQVLLLETTSESRLDALRVRVLGRTGWPGAEAAILSYFYQAGPNVQREIAIALRGVPSTSGKGYARVWKLADSGSEVLTRAEAIRTLAVLDRHREPAVEVYRKALASEVAYIRIAALDAVVDLGLRELADELERARSSDNRYVRAHAERLLAAGGVDSVSERPNPPPRGWTNSGTRSAAELLRVTVSPYTIESTTP